MCVQVYKGPQLHKSCDHFWRLLWSFPVCLGHVFSPTSLGWVCVRVYEGPQLHQKL